MIDDNNVSLFSYRVISLNVLILLIDDSDEFKCDIVLKADRKEGQEKYALLDYSDVRLKNEVFLDSRIDVLQKIHFLVFF